MGPGSEPDEIFGRKSVLGEFSDRDGRPRKRQRRNNRVDAAAVGKARVYIRLRFVDTAAERRYDALDYRENARVIGKLAIGKHEFTLTFDVNLTGAVNHYFADGIVGKKFFQGT